MGPKAIACLKLTTIRGYPQWKEAYDALCQQYSEKAVNKKMEDLARKEYIDYGVSARTGWLTEKGELALSTITQEKT